MAKGDDAVVRKKNKARRKKMQRDSSNVSARVASIIASKKRRQAGIRRKCQGMCFSLPTPDDPFNEMHGKKDFKEKDTKQISSTCVDEKLSIKMIPNKQTLSRNKLEKDLLEEKNDHMKTGLKKPRISNNNLGLESVDPGNMKVWLNKKGDGWAHANLDYPSKLLALCLNEIEKALCHEGIYNKEEDKPLFVNPWGLEFLRCYSSGKDVLETSGSSSTVEQIAWIVSLAADTIARKEKEGQSFSSPFLLFLVPSQQEAAKVRLVCKPLKGFGIHTVSLHPGASLEHQIHGLKSCEPEFLVATPERLLELVSLKAIDISSVSFLVVDGMESLYKGGSYDALQSIRHKISGNPYAVVFNNFFSYVSVPVLQNLLLRSICRVSLNHSVPSQSACILQTINLCTSEEERLPKGIQVLHQAYNNQLCSQPLNVLYIVGKDCKSNNLVKILKSSGYSVSTGSNCEISDVHNSLDSKSGIKPSVSVINAEDINTADLGTYETVILPNFVDSIDNYLQILTRMARHTIKGVLHGFLTEQDALLAGLLIEILEQCGQTVPEALINLHLTSSMES